MTPADTIFAPAAIALGNFDGIHRGHRRVIDPMLAATVGKSTVVSFDPHPKEFFTGQQQPLLTPTDEKASYLESIGVEQLILVPFNHALAQLSPRAFVEDILIRQIKTCWISVGQNFRFGYKRAGTTGDLTAIATESGIPVHLADLEICDTERISSSAIRAALNAGDLPKANRLLGRPYSIQGTVVRGQQLGRTIGFPTANLDVSSRKCLPQQGVYYVEVSHPHYPRELFPGVMNLGRRPTVAGSQQTIEVHLLDWNADLYGQTLTLYLNRFLRPEQKFESLDALKSQIQADCYRARSLIAAS
ncbi:MAG: bifunctional riboflavin kinase/FAD synthetase [Elainellaceae cyanobacterium]